MDKNEIAATTILAISVFALMVVTAHLALKQIEQQVCTNASPEHYIELKCEEVIK